MPQLIAGYFSEALLTDFIKGRQADNIHDLLKYLSHFELHTGTTLKFENPDSVAATFYNFISRGTPTLPSTFIEDTLTATFVKTRKITDKQSFKYEYINDELKDEIFRSLFIIDPRIKKENFNFTNKHPLAKRLINEFIPVNIGDFFLQLLTPNRTAQNILFNAHADCSNTENFNNTAKQKFDFSVELPYKINDNQGLTIRLTSPKDLIKEDYIEQEKLRRCLNSAYWKNNAVISEFDENDQEESQKILNFTFNDFFDLLRKNYQSPLYKSEIGLDSMQLALTPLLVARIQKTILSFILSGQLNLNSDNWDIAIIERDVPAAFLAIEDLQKTFEKLFELEGLGRQLPKINLHIYYTPEFEEAQLNILYQGNIAPLEDFDTNKQFDLLIDASVLIRDEIELSLPDTKAKNTAIIRSINYIKPAEPFANAQSIDYTIPFFTKAVKNTKEKNLENKSLENLSFFARNFFHINKLTNFQFRFTANILNNQNSLLIVPPRQHKDLLYKLATLLQPGTSLIVSPLMSGIKQQTEHLQQYFIDAFAYFTPLTEKVYDKFLALEKIRSSKVLFAYISPDRLHLQEFRTTIKTALQNKVKFSYLFVDEAHCASEWSHDFRPFYATIPNNINIIFDKQKPKISCISEFASYDVITDIRQLFDIEEDAFIKADIALHKLKINLHTFDFNYDGQKDLLEEYEQQKLLKTKELSKGRTVYITNRPNDLAQLIDPENTAIFEGTIGDKLKTISSVKSISSFEELTKYNRGEKENIAGIFSLGISTYLNGNKIFFCDIPSSIELFIQTVSRFTNTDKLEVDLTFSTKKYTKTTEETDFDETGKIIEKYYSDEQAVENIARHYHFEKLYTSTKKKLKIIDELLKQITYPSESIAQMLIRRVHYSFDRWIKLEAQPQLNPTKLYIYDDTNDLLGFIDFENGTVNNLANTKKEKLANNILYFIKFDIEKIVPNGKEIFDIIDDVIQMSPAEGLNKTWINLKNHKQTSITVEFYNNAFSELTHILQKEAKIDAELNDIIDIYENSYNVDQFIHNFIQYFNINKSQEKNLIIKIQNLYWNFRNFFDTSEALYRLYSIGVISDFIVDYQNQQFSVIIEKKDESELLNDIYHKLSAFTSKTQAISVFEQIPKITGDTMIEKAVIFYERFVHYNHYNKRRESFEKILELLEKYQDNTDKIKIYLENYFVARYIEKIERLKDKSYLNILQLFEKEQLLIDHLMHLKKSAEIVMNTEQNTNTLLIKALSTTLLNYNNENILETAIDELSKAVTDLRFKHKSLNSTNLIEQIMTIFDTYNTEIRTKTENLLMLKLHVNWLQKFNSELKKQNNSKNLH